jgi:hypothetical protein
MIKSCFLLRVQFPLFQNASAYGDTVELEAVGMKQKTLVLFLCGLLPLAVHCSSLANSDLPRYIDASHFLRTQASSEMKCLAMNLSKRVVLHLDF